MQPELQHPSLVIGQATVLFLVIVVFYFGVVVRGFISRDTRMTLAQTAIFGGAGFLLMGLPLCGPLYSALVSSDDLFVAVGAFVSPFTCGLTCRSELQQKLKVRGL